MSRQDIAERFARETAEHKMEILHDDGLYRHLRFRASETSFYWFELVTWPGSLVVRGDVDGYMFTRTTDMFEFFRMDKGQINPHYWSEKTEGGRRACKSYSEERFKQLVIEHFVEAVKYNDAPRGLGKAVREEILNDPEIYYEQGARQALESFEYKGFCFDDTWEWDFHDYDWSFLWACHAIVWGIANYDRAKAAAREAVTSNA